MLFDIPAFNKQNITPALVGQPGEAFEQFIAELYSLKGLEITPFPTAGNDGKIDHVVYSATSRHVFECKDLTKADDALGAWKKVAKTLSENIISAAGPLKGQPQYQPWYDQQQPIEKYSFCLSAQFSTDEKISNLKKIINDFFQQLSSDYAHLAHLANIEITVLAWNNLSPQAAEFPSLCYRWFTDYRIDGLTAFTDAAQTERFSSFLHSDQLAYLPSDNPAQQPQALLQQLADNTTTGLIITGVGGVGKTRLVLETGRAALAHTTDWLVLQIDAKRCKQVAIDQLVKRINPKQRVLFLCDYAEAQTNLLDILQALDDHNNMGHQLSYMANCRDSYYPQLAELENHQSIALEGNLDSSGQLAATNENSFNAKVVRHILHSSTLDNPADFISLCIGLPVLAVFIVWLNQQGQQSDLNGLRQEKSFEQWIMHRLNTALGKTDVELARKLIKLLPQYPLPVEAAELLDEQEQQLWVIHDTLVTDGWIYEVKDQDDNTHFHLAHDVFADQILTASLKLRTTPRQKQDEINSAFKLAARLNTTNSALMAWQRLANDLTALDWSGIFTKQIKTNPDQWQQHTIVAFPALTLTKLVKLKQQQPDFWQAPSPVFKKALGYKVRHAVIDHEVDEEDADFAVIITWLEALLTESDGRLLSDAIRLSPKTFQPQLEAFIAQNPKNYQTGLMIASWLQAGGQPDTISEPLQQWLQSGENRTNKITSFIYEAWLNNDGGPEAIQFAVNAWLVKHQTMPTADFMIKTWLNAKGDKVIITPHLNAWLALYHSTLDAQFVYTAWLNAKGDKTLVEQPIKDWLVIHQTTPEAGFVYAAWLNAQGNKTLIEAAVKVWLEEHQATLDTQFVYAAWLNAQGDKTLVEAPVKVWLAAHQTTSEAQFVYTVWLNAQGDKTLVEAPVKAWLVAHQTTPEAGFVYRAWLEAQGDKTLVEAAIKVWLVEHQTTPQAQFVYSAWLNAQGDKTLVEAPVKAWLAAHQTISESRFVYTAWLNAQGDKTLVEAPVKAWLVAHQTTPEAGFVYRAWLNAQGDKTLVEAPVKVWLVEHQTTPQAQFVYSAWLNAQGDKTLVEAPVKAWLAAHQTISESRFVYTAWLNAQGDKTLIEAPVKAWLVAHQTDLDAQFVYRAWLNAQGDKTLVEAPVKAWLAEHQADLDAQFLYRSWLNAQGDKTWVEAPIKAWLVVYQTTLDAQFLYRSWLDARGDKALIESSMTIWLEHHQTTPEAGFVYKGWLNAKGDTKLIEAAFTVWLDKYQTHPEADFVYRAWLEAGGEIKVVEAPIKAWLNQYKIRPEAQYVYAAWLNAKGDNQLIEAPLKAWLSIDKNQHSRGANYVINAWINAGGDFDMLKPVIINKLTALTEHKDPTGVDIIHQFNQLYTLLSNPTEPIALTRWQHLLTLYSCWFRQFADFAQLQPGNNSRYIEKPGIVYLLEAAMESDLIHPKTNKAAIDAFLSWVELWHPNQKIKVAGDIQALRQHWGL